MVCWVNRCHYLKRALREHKHLSEKLNEVFAQCTWASRGFYGGILLRENSSVVHSNWSVTGRNCETNRNWTIAGCKEQTIFNENLSSVQGWNLWTS